MERLTPSPSHGGRPGGPAPTMKDVARLAGVSQSTVSRIVNNTPVAIPVSDATRRRVLDAVAACGYRPNPLARALRGAPTMLLGAIVRDITDPFFAAAVDALGRTAQEAGYSIVLGHARARADEALRLASPLDARQCDAIFLLGDLQSESTLIEDLSCLSSPVVALWHGTLIPQFHSIGVANHSGIAQSLNHLAELGHARIAFVGAGLLGDVREREASFRQWHTDHGMDIRDGYVRHIRNTFEGGRQAVSELVARVDPPTAVVSTSDVIAVGLVAGAGSAGLRVPGDLSVVGFDDIPVALAVTPRLTTVAMPIAEMAAEAVAIARSSRSGDMPRAELFEPTLRVRESTAPPASPSISTKEQFT